MSEPPLLRVVRGEPTAEEVAAVVAVLTARGAAAQTTAGGLTTRSAWSRGAGIRRPLPAPGRGAWRASAWPTA